MTANQTEACSKIQTADADSWICDGIPDHVIHAGMDAWDQAHKEMAEEIPGVTTDWDEGMIVAHIFKELCKAATEPSPTPPMPEGFGFLAERIADIAQGAPYLHVRGQFSYHGEAFIIGNRSGLKALRDAADHAISNNAADAGVYASDGEGYGLTIKCTDLMSELGEPPYIDHLAREVACVETQFMKDQQKHHRNFWLERANWIAKARRDQPIVDFTVQEGYYLASCDACGWVGSSHLCGTDTGTDAGDSDVYCPRCGQPGADCGKVAEAVGDKVALPKHEPGDRKHESGLIQRLQIAVDALREGKAPSIDAYDLQSVLTILRR